MSESRKPKSDLSPSLLLFLVPFPLRQQITSISRVHLIYLLVYSRIPTIAKFFAAIGYGSTVAHRSDPMHSLICRACAFSKTSHLRSFL